MVILPYLPDDDPIARRGRAVGDPASGDPASGDRASAKTITFAPSADDFLFEALTRLAAAHFAVDELDRRAL
jgi:hypothetical protein